MTDVVYVKWQDAQGGRGSDTDEYINRRQAMTMESAGIYISEDDKVVRLTQDVSHDDGGHTNRDWQIIPKVNIIKVKRFKVR